MCFGVAGAHSGLGRSFRPKRARRPTEYLAERDRPVQNLRAPRKRAFGSCDPCGSREETSDGR